MYLCKQTASSLSFNLANSNLIGWLLDFCFEEEIIGCFFTHMNAFIYTVILNKMVTSRNYDYCKYCMIQQNILFSCWVKIVCRKDTSTYVIIMTCEIIITYFPGGFECTSRNTCLALGQIHISGWIGYQHLVLDAWNGCIADMATEWTLNKFSFILGT